MVPGNFSEELAVRETAGRRGRRAWAVLRAQGTVQPRGQRGPSWGATPPGRGVAHRRSKAEVWRVLEACGSCAGRFFPPCGLRAGFWKRLALSPETGVGGGAGRVAAGRQEAAVCFGPGGRREAVGLWRRARWNLEINLKGGRKPLTAKPRAAVGVAAE